MLSKIQNHHRFAPLLTSICSFLTDVRLNRTTSIYVCWYNYFRAGLEEKAVMNNYIGIGIDAKIMLEFHYQREHHPERFR